MKYLLNRKRWGGGMGRWEREIPGKYLVNSFVHEVRRKAGRREVCLQSLKFERNIKRGSMMLFLSLLLF